ncbi:MAG: flagellar biosynthetic protein FliO [Steroidobacteraceae bacterium]
MKYIVRTHSASVACWTTLGVALALGACRLACAAADAPFAQPDARPVPGQGAGILRVTLALILVLGAVFATAWFMRRVRGLGGASATGLEVLAQVPLGARERAVLIRVGERQILIGVAPGNVRTLHVLEADASTIAPSAAPPEPALRPTFKSLLLKSLGK